LFWFHNSKSWPTLSDLAVVPLAVLLVEARSGRHLRRPVMILLPSFGLAYTFFFDFLVCTTCAVFLFILHKLRWFLC